MTDIRDVPYEDIQEFLKANKKSYKNENDAYSKALILLKDNNVVGHTVKIVEWIIAHNLIKKKVNVPYYSSYEINNMPEIEVYQLSKLLTMKSNNRENIINILRYMNKLKDMELLPEIVDIIDDLLNELDIQEINQRSLDFDKIINLLKYHYNKQLVRFIIYNNLETIIDNKKNVKEDIVDEITNFIINLLNVDELGLAARVLDIAINKNYKFDSDLPSLYSELLYEVINSNDIINNDLLEKYFKLINDDYLISEAYVNVNNVMSEGGQDYRSNYIEAIEKLYIPFLKVSIKLEQEECIWKVINDWESYNRESYANSKEDYFSDDEIEKLDLLIEELEDLVKEGKSLTDDD